MVVLSPVLPIGLTLFLSVKISIPFKNQTKLPEMPWFFNLETLQSVVFLRCLLTYFQFVLIV